MPRAVASTNYAFFPRSGSIVTDRHPEELATSTKPEQTTSSRLVFSLAYAVIALITIAVFLSILKLNHGVFVYTLDDPYIHLALSDQIRAGNYGLHAGVHSAPSSSILFPFLLAVASGTAIHPYLSLLLDLAGLMVTVEVMRRFLTHLRLGQDTFGHVVEGVFLVLITVCFNLIGVVFTGLEHSLHIALVAATIYGLALFLDEGKLAPWLPVAIVVSPLIRYEGLPLSLAALFLLAVRGRWRVAAGSFVLIVASLASFSLFLKSLGLPPLPSSILVKSAIVAGGVNGAVGSFLRGLLKSANTMDGHPVGLLMLLIGVAAVVRCIQELPAFPRRWTSHGLMSLALVCLIGGHAAAGRFGWLERYEIYAVLGTAMLGLYLTQNAVRAILADRANRLLFTSAAAVALLIIGYRYETATAQVPHAANNVYEQQLQMHYFVDRFYRDSIAVNDLGLVSYHNPNFVLDLGGLASEKARLLRLNHADAATYAAFVAANGVHLVMVYDEWFPGEIPKDWVKVGSMDLSRTPLSASGSEVQFYATDAATAEKVREELKAFRGTLPSRVKLTVY